MLILPGKVAEYVFKGLSFLIKFEQSPIGLFDGLIDGSAQVKGRTAGHGDVQEPVIFGLQFNFFDIGDGGQERLHLCFGRILQHEVDEAVLALRSA